MLRTIRQGQPPQRIQDEANIHCSYTWTIEDFSKRSEDVGQLLESPSFSASGGIVDRWTLQCYPRGTGNDDEGYISVFLFAHILVKGKVEISLISERNDKSNLVNLNFNYSATKSRCGAYKCISRDNLFSPRYSTFLLNDKLSIFCSITLPRDDNLPFLAVASQLIDDFSKLILNPDFSDITFIVGNKKLFAHRAIISSRSVIFNKMLSSEMKESISKEVIIDDISIEAFEELLCFLYTGRTPNIKTLAFDLYYAADKYELSALKDVCTTVLQTTLTPSNCLKTLYLSTKHCDEKLKLPVMEFILENMEQIMETNDWNDLADSNPNLAINILSSHVKKHGLKRI